MREGFSLGRAVGHALEANLRSVRLATRVANSVAGVAVTTSASGGQRRAATGGGAAGEGQRRPLLQRPETRPAILLEGAAGSQPTALFVLENHLAHEVTASVEMTPLATPSGRKLRSVLRFEKREIVLASGQQVVARIGARITSRLVPGETYAGEIRVQGIPGASVPVVLRRIAAPAPVRRRQLTSGASTVSAHHAHPSRRPRKGAAKTPKKN